MYVRMYVRMWPYQPPLVRIRHWLRPSSLGEQEYSPRPPRGSGST